MTGPPKGLSETPEEMAEDDLILERTVFPTLGDIWLCLRLMWI